MKSELGASLVAARARVGDSKTVSCEPGNYAQCGQEPDHSRAERERSRDEGGELFQTAEIM